MANIATKSTPIANEVKIGSHSAGLIGSNFRPVHLMEDQQLTSRQKAFVVILFDISLIFIEIPLLSQRLKFMRRAAAE
jgi:hypothetical protein